MSWLVAERDRWVLWLPVGLGMGIGLYFALSIEPAIWWGPVALIGVVAFVYLLGGSFRQYRSIVIALSVVLGVIATGFTVAKFRTVLMATPMLLERIGPTSVTGQVYRVEGLPGGPRLTLDNPRIGHLGPAETPDRVRVRLRGSQPQIGVGDWVRLRAVLSPPPPPALPGSFDFQRRSFFRGLGAVGYAIAPAEVIAKAEDDGGLGVALWFAHLRQEIKSRIQEQAPGPTGAVIVALMTGERGAIPESVITSIRDSGIAHLLAISGLHIGLVAGFLFLSIRGGLSLIPPMALRYPIKKWAAVASILGAGGYVLLAGATIPSQRAFLMIGFVLAAVLFDRKGISMRLVAWAAILVLLIQPESLLGASFQLSFAAVAALVAVYEVVRNFKGMNRVPPSWPKRTLMYAGGVALTTLVAGAATAPFAAFHFHRFADFWLLANMIAVPTTALWIMPWAVVAFVLMPLGLEGVALVPMAIGVDVVIWTAKTISAWPGAVSLLPEMSTLGLSLVALGGAWLCIWHRRWRMAGILGVAAGLATIVLVEPPDVLVDGRGKLLAVRTSSGDLAISSLRAARFSREMWLRRAGQDEASPWPHHGSSEDGRLACDHLGCIYRVAGHVVALVNRPEALIDDCMVTDVVISTVPVRRVCPSAQVVVDRFDLWRDGAHALWLKGEKVRVETVNGRRGDRPWVIKPKKWRYDG